VTHFEERQQCESSERVKRYRMRYSNGECNDACNGEVAADSSSPSPSKSDSDSQEGVGAGGERKTVPGAEKPGTGGETAADPGKQPVVRRALPGTPAEAVLHPDIRVFTLATGGRIPGLSQYRTVIDTVRLLRRRNKLDDEALATVLKPYWLAWSSRKRANGQPYDPGNITWLVEWALNGFIPANHGAAREGGPNPEASAQDRAEVIRRVARGKP
jgi:hypothetical protein